MAVLHAINSQVECWLIQIGRERGAGMVAHPKNGAEYYGAFFFVYKIVFLAFLMLSSVRWDFMEAFFKIGKTYFL